MPQATAAVNFRHRIEDALPWLIAARNSGHLVPFVGAGMSMPYCAGWVDFIDALQRGMAPNGEDMAPNCGPSASEKPDPERLYRIADRVSSWLRLLPPDERRHKLVRALQTKTNSRAEDLPEQLKALTKVDWPLIVTTNYDNLIQAGIAATNPSTIPLTLGRSARDCTEIVRSFDNLHQPLIWHLQGHFPIVPDVYSTKQADALLDQIVLGHQQYQQAIHELPMFRRAFAELFCRRSLLFIGSGLAESYMVNLISEAMFGFGPGARSHYAFFSNKDCQNVDTEFLAMRLGITPIVYGIDQGELPNAIEKTTNSQKPSATSLARVMFRVAEKSSNKPIEICLSKGKLPSLRPSGSGTGRRPGRCVIASIGLDPNRYGGFQPFIDGLQAGTFLDQYGIAAEPSDCRPIGDGNPARIFRLVKKANNIRYSLPPAASPNATASRIPVIYKPYQTSPQQRSSRL